MEPGKECDATLPGTQTLARKRFKRAIRMAMINARISRNIDRCEEKSHVLSFEVFHEMEDDEEKEESKILTFNKNYFKSEKKAKLSEEVKSILMRPTRTDEELKIALTGLQSLSSFAGYPFHMQEKLVRVAHFLTLSPNRVIIRQGHRAELFYFLIHGTAIESSVDRDPVTSGEGVHLKRVLRKGDCFGEMELLYGTSRATTITSNSICELLSIEKDDFLQIFLMIDKLTGEPAHVAFIKSLPFMEGWPIEELAVKPNMCLPHYYRKGEVIVEDSNNSHWMYIIKSGSCVVELLVERGPPYIKKKKSSADRYMFLASKGMKAYAKVDHRWKKQTEFEFITQKEGDNAESGAVAKLQTKKMVLVQIDELFRKDIFGLSMLCQDIGIIDSDMPSLQLVSKGSECIILQKKFFLQYLSTEQRKWLKSSIKPYPILDDIQNRVRDHLNWKLFKEKTVLDIMSSKRQLKELPAKTP